MVCWQTLRKTVSDGRHSVEKKHQENQEDVAIGEDLGGKGEDHEADHPRGRSWRFGWWRPGKPVGAVFDSYHF